MISRSLSGLTFKQQCRPAINSEHMPLNLLCITSLILPTPEILTSGQCGPRKCLTLAALQARQAATPCRLVMKDVRSNFVPVVSHLHRAGRRCAHDSYVLGSLGCASFKCNSISIAALTLTCRGISRCSKAPIRLSRHESHPEEVHH